MLGCETCPQAPALIQLSAILLSTTLPATNGHRAAGSPPRGSWAPTLGSSQSVWEDARAAMEGPRPTYFVRSLSFPHRSRQ